MEEDRAPLGLVVAAVAAAVLAISLFLPWYGVSITTSGATLAQQQLTTIAQEYGNPAFVAQANGIRARLGSLAGRQVATVTARQTLRHETELLLILAGIALLASLLRLANARGLLFATGSQITLVGTLAGLIVFFRILVRPGGSSPLVSLSLSWGILLALLSALAIVAGGLLAGSDRTYARASTKRGPGPPPLQAPPSVRDLARAPLSPPANRRR